MSAINTSVSSSIAHQAFLAQHAYVSPSVAQQVNADDPTRVTKADPAGLAISQNMTAQISGLDQSIRKTNERIGLLQTAEATLMQQSALLERMRELATEVQSAALSSEQRAVLNTEFQQLRGDMERTGQEARWNGESIRAVGDLPATAKGVAQAVDVSFDAIDADELDSGDALSITIAGVKYESVFSGHGFPPFVTAGGGVAPQEMFEIRIDTVNNRVIVKAKMPDPFSVTEASSSVASRDPVAMGLDLSGAAGASAPQWMSHTHDIAAMESAQAVLPEIENALRSIAEHRQSIGEAVQDLANGQDASLPALWTEGAVQQPTMDHSVLEKMKEQSRNQIMQQVETALVAQATPKPATVIYLLQ